MKPPLKNLRKLSVIAIFSLVAMLPLFTGFVADARAEAAGAQINLDELMKKVMMLNQKNQQHKAIDLLIETADKQGDDSFLRVMIVQTFDLFLESEIKLGQKESEKNPVSASPYLRVSGALELLGDKFRAMEVLLNGVRHNALAPEMWMRVGRLELKANRPNEALDVFREVMRLDSKNGNAYNSAAHILVHRDTSSTANLKEAERLAASAHKLEPKNPHYLNTLAEVFFRQGDAKMAQSLIAKAIKLAPGEETLKNQLRRFTAHP